MYNVAQVLLWLFVASIPWENMVVIPRVGAVSVLLGALAMVGVIFKVLESGSMRRPGGVHAIMFVYVGYTAMSYFWSQSPDVTLVRAWTYMQFLLMMWLVWLLAREPRDVYNLLQAYVYGAWIAVGGTIVNFALNGTGTFTRFAAAGFDPNELGLALALAIPMAWFLSLVGQSTLTTWTNRLYVIAACGAVILTGSRGAALSLMAALLVIPFTLHRISWWQRVIMAGLLVVAVYSFLQYVPQASWTRLMSIRTELAQGDLAHRRLIWAAGWAVFLDHLVVGVGAGAFRTAVRPYDLVAHNTFLSILTEQGVVGFALFLSVAFYSMRSIWKATRLSKVLWVVTFLTWGVGVSALTWEHRKTTWLLFALVAAAGNPLPSRASDVRAEQLPGTGTARNRSVDSEGHLNVCRQ